MEIFHTVEEIVPVEFEQEIDITSLEEGRHQADLAASGGKVNQGLKANEEGLEKSSDPTVVGSLGVLLGGRSSMGSQRHCLLAAGAEDSK